MRKAVFHPVIHPSHVVALMWIPSPAWKPLCLWGYTGMPCVLRAIPVRCETSRIGAHVCIIWPGVNPRNGYANGIKNEANDIGSIYFIC